MERYEHGGDIYGNYDIKFDFSVNTNPLAMPKEVCRAIIENVDSYSNYPDTKCRELSAAISLHENVPERIILCGNGAADLIYRLCYSIKPQKAVICAPAFSEYERALEQSGCEIIRHFLLAENQFDLSEEITEKLSADIDLIFICNPNNPTGRLILNDVLMRILYKANESNIKIVIDECFLDFSDGISAKKYLMDMENLIVLKAFTKIYAMAGLRLGYIMTYNEKLLNKMKLSAQIWSVSVPAQIAGIAALSNEKWITETRRLISEERIYLSERLSDLGISVVRSDANFLLIYSEKPLYEKLLKKGILIRRCENFAGLSGAYYRIAVKRREENIFLIKEITEILNG